MALRSVLGKMGSSMTMTSSKCIHNNARLVLMLRNFDKHKMHDHSDNNKEVVSKSAANAYLFELGCYDANGVRIPMTVNRGFDYHMDLGGLGPARFAVEDFNKRKNPNCNL